MEKMLKPWVIKTRGSVLKSDGAEDADGSFDDEVDSLLPKFQHSKWEPPTVDWLRQPQLFTPSLLPKMAVPDSKSRGVYQSKEHYHDKLERLMVGMAFSDGYAALVPRCFDSKPGGTGSCGNALVPVGEQKVGIVRGGQLCCRSKNCRGEVLACTMGTHSRGLCACCADRKKALLLGSAGPHTSTHVYDALVRRSVESRLA
jgi:hypothetical protein